MKTRLFGPAVVLAMLCLYSCKKIECGPYHEEIETHFWYIYKGENAFRAPSLIPRLPFPSINTKNLERFRFRAKVDTNWVYKEAWWDSDWHDWSKLTGFYFHDLLNQAFCPNCDAVMIGIRFNPHLELMEVTPYVNRDKQFETGDIIAFDSSEWVYGEIIRHDKNLYQVIIHVADRWIDNTFIVDELGMVRPIRTWYGGGDDQPCERPNGEPCEYGGRAPQYMSVELGFCWHKK